MRKTSEDQKYILQTYSLQGHSVRKLRSLNQSEDFELIHLPITGRIKYSRTIEEDYVEIKHLQPGTFCVDPVDELLRVVEIGPEISEESCPQNLTLVAVTLIILISVLVTCIISLVKSKLGFFLFKNKKQTDKNPFLARENALG